jgi:hypothetical protein
VENQQLLTTQQLAQQVRESVQKMSPEEKAEVRKYLNRAFKLTGGKYVN